MSRYGAKETVDGVRSLDVLYFQRNDLFSGSPGWMRRMNWTRNGEYDASIGWTSEGSVGAPASIRLNYSATHRDTTTACDYYVCLATTACNYGGVRWWFVCPASIHG